jgi:hypothetical protein
LKLGKSSKEILAVASMLVTLLGGLLGAIVNYTSIINGKESQIATLTREMSQLQTWLEGNSTRLDVLLEPLRTQLSDLQSRISSFENETTTKDLEISLLNSQISNLQNQISDLNAQITAKDSQISDLQNQVNDLNGTVNLKKYTLWINETVNQSAGSEKVWEFSPSYAGYIVVEVESSSSNTSVLVRSESYGAFLTVDSQVGLRGRFVFPVLPCSFGEDVIIKVYNDEDDVTLSILVIYYY